METQEYKNGFDYCLKNKKLIDMIIRRNLIRNKFKIDQCELFNQVTLIVASKWKKFNNRKGYKINSYFGKIIERAINEYVLKNRLMLSYSHVALTNKKVNYLARSSHIENNKLSLESKDYYQNKYLVDDSYLYIDDNIDKKNLLKLFHKYIEKHLTKKQKQVFSYIYNKNLIKVKSFTECANYLGCSPTAVRLINETIIKNFIRRYLKD